MYAQLALMVLCGSTWLVTGKLLADALPSFTFFITQVFALMLIVTMAPMTKSRTILPSRRLLGRFVAMGTLDNAGMILSMLSNPHVDGGMQVLLTQAIIPLAMLNSFLFLKRRYRATHYLGAAVIIAGIAVSVADSLLSGSSGSWGWLLVALLANVPTSLSCVLKDATFKPHPGAPMDLPSEDVYWVNLWVSVFQFLSGLPLSPLVASLLGSPLQQLPDNFRRAVDCIFTLQSAQGCSDKCEVSSAVLLAVYTASGVAYGVCMLALITRESAALAVTGAALTVPVANLAFSVPWLQQMDGSLLGFSWWNIGSLLLVVCGLALYLHSPEQPPETDEIAAPLCPLARETDDHENTK